MTSFAVGKHSRMAAAVVFALYVVGASTATAQERHEFRGPRIELDARYHHDRYYPVHGFFMERLPAGAVSIDFGPARYYYHAGVWFRPVGARFEVITPPMGVVIPVLPSGYVSLTVGGAPYFYANGVYYAPAAEGYSVVAPPPGAETALPSGGPAPSTAAAPVQPTSSGAPRDPIAYPRNGQTAAQQATDERDCKQWAEAKPGITSDPGVLERAQTACLEGRGYTVR